MSYFRVLSFWVKHLNCLRCRIQVEGTTFVIQQGPGLAFQHEIAILGGGFNPVETYDVVKLAHFPQVGVKMKNM